jgi:MerR family transcriptional regulator, light-induced transcriptional regulator
MSSGRLPAIAEACYRRYLKALLAGDRHACIDIFQDQLQQGVSLKTLYLDLVQRAMYEVGTLWERNRIAVATEHLASATTEMVLTTVYPLLFSQPHKDLRAIITCVPNEYHQIGARMVADFFELQGWHGFILGANTPTDGLLRMIAERDPDLVGFSMSMLFNRAHLELMVAAVSQSFPALRLLLGGRAFQGADGRQAREQMRDRFPGLRYLESLNDLEDYLSHV